MQQNHNWFAKRFQLVFAVFFLSALSAGCTSWKEKGETRLLAWQTGVYRNYIETLEEREVYRYKLKLCSPQRQKITFTELKAKIRTNAQSPRFDWHKTGPWDLDPEEGLELDLYSYRLCRQVNCVDRGPFAPLWDLTLIGEIGEGENKQEVADTISFRLPFAKRSASKKSLPACPLPKDNRSISRG